METWRNPFFYYLAFFEYFCYQQNDLSIRSTNANLFRFRTNPSRLHSSKRFVYYPSDVKYIAILLPLITFSHNNKPIKLSTSTQYNKNIGLYLNKKCMFSFTQTSSIIFLAPHLPSSLPQRDDGTTALHLLFKISLSFRCITQSIIPRRCRSFPCFFREPRSSNANGWWWAKCPIMNNINRKRIKKKK